MAKEKKHLFSCDIPNRVFDLWGCHKRKNLPRNFILEGINLMINSVNREVNDDGNITAGGSCSILQLPNWDVFRRISEPGSRFGVLCHCKKIYKHSSEDNDEFKIKYRPLYTVNRERIIVPMPDIEATSVFILSDDIRNRRGRGGSEYGPYAVDPFYGIPLKEYTLSYESDIDFGGTPTWRHCDDGDDTFNPDHWRIYPMVESKVTSGFEIPGCDCKNLNGIEDIALIRLNFGQYTRWDIEKNYDKLIVPCKFTKEELDEEYDEYSFSLLPLRDKDGKRIIFKPKKDEDVMFTYKALTVGSDLSFILRGDPGCHAWDMTKNKVKPLKD